MKIDQLDLRDHRKLKEFQNLFRKRCRSWLREQGDTGRQFSPQQENQIAALITMALLELFPCELLDHEWHFPVMEGQECTRCGATR